MALAGQFAFEFCGWPRLWRDTYYQPVDTHCSSLPPNVREYSKNPTVRFPEQSVKRPNIMQRQREAICSSSSRHISSAWVVYLGRQSQNGANEYEVKRPVSEIIIHPRYNDTTLDSDIALLKLHSPVAFSPHIRPICLASNSSRFYNPTSCWVTGWGKDNKSGE